MSLSVYLEKYSVIFYINSIQFTEIFTFWSVNSKMRFFDDAINAMENRFFKVLRIFHLRVQFRIEQCFSTWGTKIPKGHIFNLSKLVFPQILKLWFVFKIENLKHREIFCHYHMAKIASNNYIADNEQW